MRKILISLIVGFIFISVLSLDAYAQMCGGMGGAGGGMRGGMGMMEGMEHPGMGMMYGMGGMMMEGGPHMWKHLMHLGLDEKQQEALKALRSKTMKEMAKKRADMAVAGIELRDLLDKEPVDMKAVEAAAKKKASIQTEMFLAHVKAHEEMKSILTPEQKKKLKEMMESDQGPGCGMMGGAAERRDMPMHQHMP